MTDVGSRGSAAALAACLAVIAACQSRHFEGGQLRDVGVPLYPRFVATFEPVPFDRPGEYAFPFRGFPAQHAGVVLETPSRPDVKTLEVLTTVVELSISDQAGAVRCSGFGSPAGEEPYRLVVWSNSGAAAGLWHSGCSGVDLTHCDPCTLRVKLSAVDSRTPAVPVMPALHSGKGDAG